MLRAARRDDMARHTSGCHWRVSAKAVVRAPDVAALLRCFSSHANCLCHRLVHRTAIDSCAGCGIAIPWLVLRTRDVDGLSDAELLHRSRAVRRSLHTCATIHKPFRERDPPAVFCSSSFSPPACLFDDIGLALLFLRVSRIIAQAQAMVCSVIGELIIAQVDAACIGSGSNWSMRSCMIGRHSLVR